MNYFKKILAIILLSFYALSGGTNSRAEENFILAQDLDNLRLSLLKAGFIVKIEKPPIQGTYGLVNLKKKIIWIAPITQEMGIFRTTFLHEAVHAAQSCKTGEFQPIGWKLEVDKAVEIYINSVLYRQYSTEKFDIEREAFLMQGQNDAVKKISSALEKDC